jgi:hypothetical protein
MNISFEYIFVTSSLMQEVDRLTLKHSVSAAKVGRCALFELAPLVNSGKLYSNQLEKPSFKSSGKGSPLLL